MSEDLGPDAIDGFAPWDGRRVPVTLLGGYLGSGKTTAINELLAITDRPVAVLVNDVGAVNVDAALIARRHGDTIELTDGCVCCGLNNGLADAFDQIRRRPSPPDHVLLELSGVADPRPVLPWATTAGFRLDGVIILIDADQFLDRADDAGTAATVEAQLSSADLFLMTKTDLASDATVVAVTERLAGLAPGVPVLRSDSPTAGAAFLNLGTRNPRGLSALPAPSLFDAHETSLVSLPDPIDLAELDRVLAGLGDRALRAKAVVRDNDGIRHLVQVVGKRRLITPLPAAEDQPPTDLVVITARR